MRLEVAARCCVTSFLSPSTSPLPPYSFRFVVTIIQVRLNRRLSLFGRDDRNVCEFRDVVPVRHPLVEERAVVAVHYLNAALEISRDPAGGVAHASWGHTVLLSESAVD